MEKKSNLLMFFMVTMIISHLILVSSALAGLEFSFENERLLYAGTGDQSNPRIDHLDRVVFMSIEPDLDGELNREIFMAFPSYPRSEDMIYNLTNTPDSDEFYPDTNSRYVVYEDGGSVKIIDPGGVTPVLIKTIYGASKPRTHHDYVVYEYHQNLSDQAIMAYQISTENTYTVWSSGDPKNAAVWSGDFGPEAERHTFVVFEDSNEGTIILKHMETGYDFTIDTGFNPDIYGPWVVYSKNMGGGMHDVFYFEFDVTEEGIIPLTPPKNITNSLSALIRKYGDVFLCGQFFTA